MKISTEWIRTHSQKRHRIVRAGVTTIIKNSNPGTSVLIERLRSLSSFSCRLLMNSSMLTTSDTHCGQIGHTVPELSKTKVTDMLQAWPQHLRKPILGCFKIQHDIFNSKTFYRPGRIEVFMSIPVHTSYPRLHLHSWAALAFRIRTRRPKLETQWYIRWDGKNRLQKTEIWLIGCSMQITSIRRSYLHEQRFSSCLISIHKRNQNPDDTLVKERVAMILLRAT